MTVEIILVSIMMFIIIWFLAEYFVIRGVENDKAEEPIEKSSTKRRIKP